MYLSQLTQLAAYLILVLAKILGGQSTLNENFSTFSEFFPYNLQMATEYIRRNRIIVEMFLTFVI